MGAEGDGNAHQRQGGGLRYTRAGACSAWAQGMSCSSLWHAVGAITGEEAGHWERKPSFIPVLPGTPYMAVFVGSSALQRGQLELTKHLALSGMNSPCSSCCLASQGGGLVEAPSAGFRGRIEVEVIH